jgi:DNA-binding response OmpR family regulator
VEAPIVQKFLRAVLEREGYESVEADPQSALEMMKVPGPGVGLVITNSPGMFLPFADHVPLIYIAACPDLDLAARFRSCRVLQKPFHPTELLEAVKCLRVSSKQ